jgi:hypothetical protein
MGSKIFVLLLSAAFVGLICCLFYLEQNKYEVIAGPQNTVYKIDRQTGETTWIVGHKEQIVPKAKEPTKNEKAIELVKNYFYQPWSGVIERAISDHLTELEGDVSVIGWQSVQLDSNAYFVTFKWKQNGVLTGVGFEALLDPYVVRIVRQDEDSLLFNKYKNLILKDNLIYTKCERYIVIPEGYKVIPDGDTQSRRRIVRPIRNATPEEMRQK